MPSSATAEENGLSRVLIGFHFRKTVEAAIEHGRRIGKPRSVRFRRPVHRVLGVVAVRWRRGAE